MLKIDIIVFIGYWVICFLMFQGIILGTRLYKKRQNRIRTHTQTLYQMQHYHRIHIQDMMNRLSTTNPNGPPYKNKKFPRNKSTGHPLTSIFK